MERATEIERAEKAAVDRFRRVCKCLPPALAEACRPYPMAEELRLRAGQSAMIWCDGDERILPVAATRQDITEAAEALAEHSLFARAEQIKRGYFAAAGGVRVGVGGRVCADDRGVSRVDDFTSLCIRFPREHIGIAYRVMSFCARGRAVLGTLIISPPQQGKTTLLRDMIRAVSKGEGCAPKRCVVIDERGELSGDGEFDLGPRTDVLLGAPRAAGMEMAIRSLSPEVIATDEIGGEQELAAVREAMRSGVTVFATAHGSGAEQVLSRQGFGELAAEGAFPCIVELSDERGRGTVSRVTVEDRERWSLPPAVAKGGFVLCS